MRYLRRYNESVTIKATNNDIDIIIEDEIDKLGNRGDLNHIDVSVVTNMMGIFLNSMGIYLVGM